MKTISVKAINLIGSRRSHWDILMDEVQLVRESLFGPRIEYVTLLKLTGDHAASLLKTIVRKGPEFVLTTLLVSANLEPGERTYDRPWGIFAENYKLGDYHLVWSFKDDTLCVYEETIPSDEYSNV